MTEDYQRVRRIPIHDPILKRNYNLLGHYLIYLIDSGLDFLKREYLKSNSETTFKKFSAENFYNFILRDYIREKIKNQVKTILNAAIMCISEKGYQSSTGIDSDFLDEIVRKNWNDYNRNDLTLLNTSPTHPGHQELKTISKLTFRISVIQASRLLNIHQEEDIETYGDLVRATFPNIQQCRHSINSILSIINEMIDCFERNLNPSENRKLHHLDNFISIPFFKPTYTVRNFQYVRNVYEYAQQVLEQQLRQIYIGDV